MAHTDFPTSVGLRIFPTDTSDPSFSLRRYLCLRPKREAVPSLGNLTLMGGFIPEASTDLLVLSESWDTTPLIEPEDNLHAAWLEMWEYAFFPAEPATWLESWAYSRGFSITQSWLEMWEYSQSFPTTESWTDDWEFTLPPNATQSYLETWDYVVIIET
jgi:hypothetical protein